MVPLVDMAGVNGRDSPPPQGATNTRPSDVEAPPAQLEPQAPTDSFALPPAASSGSSVEDAKDAKAIVASLQVDGQQGPGAPAPNGGAKGDEDSGEAPVLEVVTYWDITKQFSLLGWSAFGGPAAHIGLFEKVSLLPLSRPLPVSQAHRQRAGPRRADTDKGTEQDTDGTSDARGQDAKAHSCVCAFVPCSVW